MQNPAILAVEVGGLPFGPGRFDPQNVLGHSVDLGFRCVFERGPNLSPRAEDVPARIAGINVIVLRRVRLINDEGLIAAVATEGDPVCHGFSIGG
jgi:hypothetical protein